MTTQLALVANMALLMAMVVSVLRFAWAAIPDNEHRRPRLMAAGTSAITLLAAGLIYSGEFDRVAVDAVAAWDKPDLLADVASITASIDGFFIEVSRWLALGADIGEQPYRPMWPAYLLAAVYVLRFLIYIAVFRRKYADSNVTGAVIWSHITAYFMVISFAIIVPGWSPWVVLPLAVIALLAIATVLIGILRDAVVMGFESMRLTAAAVIAFAGEVARAAVGFAGVVRLILERARKWYEEHISERVDRRADRMQQKSKALRTAAAKHLAEQNQSYRTKFRKKPKGEADPPPEPDIPLGEA